MRRAAAADAAGAGRTGSVSLTGRQTGLYPLERPGSWNLISALRSELVNVDDGYFPLRPGRPRLVYGDR